MAKRTLIFAAFAACIWFVVSSPAQDASASVKQVTEFDVNGMKVLVKRRPGTPTVATGLFVKGGTRALPANSAGLEALTLDVATEGSVGFPRATLRREMSSTGSVIGSSSVYDYSAFSATSTLGNFDRTWQIFTDVALRPAFAPADIERVRSRRLNSLQTSEDDPDSSLQLLVDRSLLASTNYGTRPDGTLESLRKFTRADLVAYHKQIMVTSRLLLVIVGDVDPEKIKQLASSSFGKLPKGDFKMPNIPALDFSKGTVDVTNRPLETNYTNGIFAAPSLGDPDYYAMQTAISILSGRVFQEVRVKRNLSYAPSANLGSLAVNTGAIYVTAVDANQAVKVMLDEIGKLRTDLVGEDELTATGNFFLTTYFLGQETNAAQAGRLAQYELIGGGWRNAYALLDGIKGVTREQVRDVSAKYMKNLRFYVVGDPKAIDRKVFVGG